jgi:hypothetical protein
MKYKVGDKARVTNVIHALKKGYVGGEVIIKSINPNGNLYPHGTHYGVEHSCYVFTEKELEPINEKKIVITVNGTETLAKLYEGNKVIKSAVAKCSPEDEFDFETGARIAFDRLVGEKPVEEKPKYYNGKVVCVCSKSPDIPKGKIYNIVDGVFTFDDGRVIDEKYKSFEQFNDSFLSDFIEVVE